MPSEAIEAFGDVDLVIHAGDICEPEVIRDLENVAPVVAVRGNHDRNDWDLPDTAVVDVAGARIGVIHGERHPMIEYSSALWLLATGRVRMGSHCRALARQLPKVDCLVSGHIHIPIDRTINGTHFFSPGAAYQPEGDPDFDWSSRGRRIYRAVRRRLPAESLTPAVGVLEITNGRIHARAIQLTEPTRAGMTKSAPV